MENFLPGSSINLSVLICEHLLDINLKRLGSLKLGILGPLREKSKTIQFSEIAANKMLKPS